MNLFTNNFILFWARTLLYSTVSLEFVLFRGHEYHIGSHRCVRSHREADTMCENENASLVVIDTIEIQDFLEKKFSRSLVSIFCFKWL